jgi:hypothetical protein
MLAAMVLAGVAGSAVLPPAVARRDAAFAFLRVASLAATAGCVVLALAPGAAWVAVAPLGLVLLTSLPVILELTERRAGAAGGAAAALVWLAGNAGGILVAVLVQALEGRPAAAFALLAVTAALVLPLTRQEAGAAQRTRRA